MKRIRMIRTMDGSRDGLRVETFMAGLSYELNDDLADVFLGGGVAEQDKQAVGPGETKLKGKGKSR